MTIDHKIRDEKLQYDINKIKAAKISTLSSGNTDKCEHLTSKEILPSDQRRMMKQAKLTYSPLRKALEKERKTIGDQGREQMLLGIKTKDLCF